ncbi:MAG TPA: TetR/AcrR family transcriptional regulator [Baekduia sp.]|uniref:TetR/AcrR family transcriptional regulator n=1 Tax=Baekduia sp. TaxID=2600305 RepID=UPI002B8CCF98|nr:TetR/AcrR family transcriptional regulator [Baekduia sp.]HMJ33201.1 TetR/AcrR family transcriptional regulator [Baekduia sp.]
MARRSVADTARTHAAILERSVDVASIEGLEGLTIGRLAADLQMSKAGLLGHFGTKEELQLAALAAAVQVYRREIWEPAQSAAPGRARLLAIADAWLDYLARDVFPGGCFVTAASAEFDDRPGRVRDAVASAHRRWMAVLADEARTAIRAGELPRTTDPEDVAFGLNAIAMGVNQARRLLGDAAAPDRGWRAMRTLLGSPRARRRRTAATTGRAPAGRRALSDA